MRTYKWINSFLPILICCLVSVCSAFFVACPSPLPPGPGGSGGGSNGGDEEDFINFPYKPGISRYYVEYEIHFMVNDFSYDIFIERAYFDTYAAAWTFAHTGGINPTPLFMEIWMDYINRWWGSDTRENYMIETIDYEGIRQIFWGNVIFPRGTELAPPSVSVTVNGFTTVIGGRDGLKTEVVTEYERDPGYEGDHDPITIVENEWLTYYEGWILGIPDVYKVCIIPVNIVVYECY